MKKMKDILEHMMNKKATVLTILSKYVLEAANNASRMVKVMEKVPF